MEPLLVGLLRNFGGFRSKLLRSLLRKDSVWKFPHQATSKKSRPPSGYFRLSPTKLPRSPPEAFRIVRLAGRLSESHGIFCNFLHPEFRKVSQIFGGCPEQVAQSSWRTTQHQWKKTQRIQRGRRPQNYRALSLARFGLKNNTESP